MRRPKQRTKRRNRRSERTRRIAAVAAVLALLTAGLFAAREAKIELSSPKPAATPSDDEIYTGSILFVPDDGKVCRRFLFDNRTARLSYGGLVDCESAYYRSPSTPPHKCPLPVRKPSVKPSGTTRAWLLELNRCT
jgi:hypothetical protein